MASSIAWYDHSWKLIATGGIDLDTDTLKLALVTSSYTPNIAHEVWDNGANDATDPSFNEASNGDGYATGGVTLASPVVTNGKIDFTDPAWTSLTKTFRYAVCYVDKVVGSLTDPLLFYILLDTTPANIVSSGSNFTIQINPTDGLFYRPA